MVARYRPPPAKKRGGNYFPASAPLQFIRSGCTLLDCVMSGPRLDGGSWTLGRMANLVGDKSTGKTLLAIEACANFAQQFPKGKMYYREAEAAFDVPYAQGVGLPLARVDFGKDGPDTLWNTVEQIFDDLDQVLNELEKSGEPAAYIIDSLDALSAKAILERGVEGLGGYNLEKPKVLGQMFQQLSRRIKKTRMALVIISQVRDRIGVTFGEQHTRSGGNAMDFYASHILWLSHLAILTRELKGQKRAIGVRIRAKCKKNKVAPAFRECEFPIMFGYGVDDLAANLEFLKQLGTPLFKELATQVKTKGQQNDPTPIIIASRLRETAPPTQLEETVQKIRDATIEAWEAVERGFQPIHSKYARPENGQE